MTACIHQNIGYDAPVTSKKGVIGLEARSKAQRLSRAITGKRLFVCTHGAPFGGLCRETKVSPFLRRSSNLHSLPPSFGSEGDRFHNLFLRSHTMTNAIITSAPAAQTMSSLEIAKLTGKQHNNVLRDIRNTLNEAGISLLNFEQQKNYGTKGRTREVFELPRLECDLVISGYSVKYRLAIIKRWHELEAQQATTPSTLGNRRFLVSYDNGKEQIQALDISDCVLKYADLPKLITARDNRLTTDFLMAVQGACVARMAGDVLIANEANKQLRQSLMNRSAA